MTISGLVSHLRWVEHSWFEVRMLGEEDQGPWTDEDPDREFRIAIPLAQHMTEESARHNGHIDILREMADGVTGV